MARRLARSTVAAQIYKRKAAGQRVGGGGRFRALTEALEHKGARTPKALAAWIGRKKYGAKRMAQMAAAGRRKKG